MALISMNRKRLTEEDISLLVEEAMWNIPYLINGHCTIKLHQPKTLKQKYHYYFKKNSLVTIYYVMTMLVKSSLGMSKTIEGKITIYPFRQIVPWAEVFRYKADMATNRPYNGVGGLTND